MIKREEGIYIDSITELVLLLKDLDNMLQIDSNSKRKMIELMSYYLKNTHDASATTFVLLETDTLLARFYEEELLQKYNLLNYWGVSNVFDLADNVIVWDNNGFKEILMAGLSR